MGHHTNRETVTREHYSSSSSDKETPSGSNTTVSELANTHVYANGFPKNSPLTAPVSNSQTNIGMFQTVNTRFDQSKDKTTCCDCLLNLFFKS